MTDRLASLAIVVGESLLLSLIVKVTVVAGAGLLVAAAMRHARASRRYVVLAWTFVVLAGLPTAALLASPFTIVVRETVLRDAAEPVAAESPAAAAPGAAAAVMPVSGRGPAASARASAPVDAAPSPNVSVRTIGALLWAVGFGVCLVPMFASWRVLRTARRSGLVWREERIGRRRVVVLRHEGTSAPLTFGLLRPVILLPRDAAEWDAGDVERALVHELEHVRRCDWPLHLFARFVCAVYWFHPLVWRACRHLYLEADRACDDAVVSRCEGQAFAEQLVSLASRISAGVPSATPSMARGDLTTRVRAMVSAHQARGPAGIAFAAMAGLVAVTAGAGLSPLEAVEDTLVIRSGVDRVLEPRAPVAAHPIPRVTPAVAPRARQMPAVARPARFEVASVIRDETRSSGGIPTFSGNAFVVHSVTVETLVAWAYGLPRSPRLNVATSPSARHPVVRPRAIVDALPVSTEPVMAERFDISGKAPGLVADPQPGTLSQFQLMVQTLLAERFKLAVRWAQRDRFAYRLTRTEQDPPGRLLVQMPDCWSRHPMVAAPVPIFSLSCGDPPSPATFSMTGVTMSDFAARLGQILGLEVFDRTGLEREVDVRVRFHAINAVELGALPDALRGPLARNGLRLEPILAPGDVLVIEHVEMPER